MARLPSRFDLSGSESLRSGRQISSAETTAIGRGLQSLGASIQQAGNVAGSIAAQEKQKDTALGIARANAYQDQQNIELANSFANDPDYATFGTRADEKARQIAAQAAEFIPDPEARKLWLVQAETTAKVATDNVLDKGVALKRQDDLVKLDEALEVQRRIYVDPASTEDQRNAARAKIEGTIEVAKGTGLLLPNEYSARKQAFLDDADLTRAKLDTTLTDARAGYYAAIKQAESGGDANARSGTSSASGHYGFTDPTWERLVRNYPSAGLNIAGKNDPAQQERAIRLLTAENERALMAAGIPVTNASLYAAHFLGAGVADDVLKAPDGAAVAGLVPREYLKANPFLADMSVGEFKAWAAKKAGGDAPMPEYFQRLAPEQRQLVLDMREAEARQLATAQAAQAKIEYANLDGQIGLGILTGDIVSEQQILESALDDADKAKHLRSFRSEQNATAEARAFLSGLADGTARDVNPYSSDDRALVDKSYDLLTKAVPEDQRDAAAFEFVRSTGVVPKAVVAGVRQALNARDPATVAAGLGKAAQLYDIAPMSIDAVENGGELRTAALTYDELVNGRGLTDMQAAEEVMRLRDPKERQKAETLDAAWKQAVKDNTFGVQDVRAALDTNWLWGEPSAGLTPLQEQGLASDYLAAAERAFRGQAQGDVGLAKKMALDEMKRTYGVSNVSGSETIMKYPPELFFPPMGGDHAYIRDMAMKDALSVNPGATNATLLATTETAQDVKAGKAPRYLLMVQGKDGVWDFAPGLFTVDGDELAKLLALESEERRVRFEAERKQKQEYASMPLYGSGGKTIPIYGGGNYLTPPSGPDEPLNQSEVDARLKEIDAQRRDILGRPAADEPQSDASSVPDMSEQYQQQFEQSFSFGGLGVTR